MTRKDAMKFCRLLSPIIAPSIWIVEGLKESWPEFNWRVILDRSGERSCWSLTIDDKDKRVHYVPAKTDRCVCCDKSSKQLGVKKREELDRS